MYWLLGRKYKQLEIQNINLTSIRFKLIWTYGVPLWYCIIGTKRQICWLINKKLQKELVIKWVHEVRKDYAVKHEKRLQHHTNVKGIPLLDNSEDVRWLKRTKSYELVLWILCCLSFWLSYILEICAMVHEPVLVFFII